MEETIPLCALQPGQWAVVQAIHTTDSLRRRLLDMGLTPGRAVLCIGRSPGGDPSAYQICEAIVAIRRRDAAHIPVARIPGPQEEEAYGSP